MSFDIREATAADGAAILEMLPRLASFDIPPSRVRRHLWMHDEKLLRRWMEGETDAAQITIAVGDNDALLGFAMVTLRPELLSLEPSAHLEAIAIADGAEGQGIGRSLLRRAEERAQASGALSITLHAFATNKRACAFYEQSGYDAELRRYIKTFGD
ncbi:MAG: GNAT family N-acetyltransferase [Gammaproteobacteria bacterium]|nr:GNAT family N-acetyltransferase [Gammaproteobacteria bacterium]